MLSNNKLERHVHNIQTLTGRSHGKFLQNGAPRGCNGSCEEKHGTFHKAVFVPTDEVLSTLGLTDDGTRTPYQELHPAIEKTPMTEIVQFDEFGRPLTRTKIVGTGSYAEVIVHDFHTHRRKP